MSVTKKASDDRLLRLGAHLRLARARRGLSMADVAARVGVSVRPVRELEKGNPATSIGVAFALLELYGLGDDLERVADPARDVEGLRLGGPQDRKRARRKSPSSAAPAARPKPTIRTSVSLPERVRVLLSQTELAALSFAEGQGSARTRELAEAVDLKPNRLSGLMRELRRKLVGLGERDYLVIENLPDGDVLFRVTKGVA